MAHCHFCASSLVLPAPAVADVLQESFDFWAANQLGELVALAAKSAGQFECFAGLRLKCACKRVGVDTAGALMHRAGVSKVTAWSWWSGQVAPSLPMALRICFSLGLDFVTELQGGECERNGGRMAPEEAQMELHLNYKTVPRRRDWETLRKSLVAESRQPIAHAKTLAAVGRELGIHVRALRQREARLCRVIAKRALRRKSREIAARSRLLKKQIRSVCAKMQRGGMNLTQANIAAALERPGLFSRPTARRALAELLHEWPKEWSRQITFPSAQSLH